MEKSKDHSQLLVDEISANVRTTLTFDMRLIGGQLHGVETCVLGLLESLVPLWPSLHALVKAGVCEGAEGEPTHHTSLKVMIIYLALRVREDVRLTLLSSHSCKVGSKAPGG